MAICWVWGTQFETHQHSFKAIENSHGITKIGCARCSSHVGNGKCGFHCIVQRYELLLYDMAGYIPPRDCARLMYNRDFEENNLLANRSFSTLTIENRKFCREQPSQVQSSAMNILHDIDSILQHFWWFNAATVLHSTNFVWKQDAPNPMVSFSQVGLIFEVVN